MSREATPKNANQNRTCRPPTFQRRMVSDVGSPTQSQSVFNGQDICDFDNCLPCQVSHYLVGSRKHNVFRPLFLASMNRCQFGSRVSRGAIHTVTVKYAYRHAIRQRQSSALSLHTHTHTHTHIYIYIYIHIL